MKRIRVVTVVLGRYTDDQLGGLVLVAGKDLTYFHTIL
jgi:hypothetical protein